MTRFLYKLALALGKTVEEIRDMDGSEFMGWQAYYAVLAREAEDDELSAAALGKLNQWG